MVELLDFVQEQVQEERFYQLPKPLSRKEVRLKAIDEMDLLLIRKRATLYEEWTPEQADIAEREYRYFLKLAVLCPKHKIVPSLLADLMWHCHVLDTRKYHADCQAIFGHYLHHCPSEEDSSVEYAHTQELLQEFFGISFSRKGAYCKDSSKCSVNNCGLGN